MGSLACNKVQISQTTNCVLIKQFHFSLKQFFLLTITYSLRKGEICGWQIRRGHHAGGRGHGCLLSLSLPEPEKFFLLTRRARLTPTKLAMHSQKVQSCTQQGTCYNSTNSQLPPTTCYNSTANYLPQLVTTARPITSHNLLQQHGQLPHTTCYNSTANYLPQLVTTAQTANYLPQLVTTAQTANYLPQLVTTAQTANYLPQLVTTARPITSHNLLQRRTTHIYSSQVGRLYVYN